MSFHPKVPEAKRFYRFGIITSKELLARYFDDIPCRRSDHTGEFAFGK
jgi:hypothetical protein